MSIRKPNNSSSNLISVASRLLSGELQKQLAKHNIDITIEQWTLLYYLWEKDGITQNELASIANKEKSTITRHLDALQKKGLIARESHPTDKRNKLLVLTEKGENIKTASLGSAQLVTEKAEQDIDAEDLKTFKNVLSQIIGNLHNL
jgi:DNA-binding MarR family transcriptional regulator